MKCFYCKAKMLPDSPVDICDECLFHLDESEQDDYDYQQDVQRDIEALMNKTGVTPRRLVE